jgi:hypothetical protein
LSRKPSKRYDKPVEQVETPVIEVKPEPVVKNTTPKIPKIDRFLPFEDTIIDLMCSGEALSSIYNNNDDLNSIASITTLDNFIKKYDVKNKVIEEQKRRKAIEVENAPIVEWEDKSDVVEEDVVEDTPTETIYDVNDLLKKLNGIETELSKVKRENNTLMLTLEKIVG